MDPFEEIIGKLDQRIILARSTPQERDLVCVGQLRLLQVQYNSMTEFNLLDFHGEKFREGTYRSRKAVLDYLTYINLLNQLSRVLWKKYKIDISLANRIAFYRNKAQEHWDEYARYAPNGSLTQEKGKIAVPSMSEVFNPDERIRIKSEIDSLLAGLGKRKFDIENPETANIADLPENVEKIYALFEGIDPSLVARQGDNVIPSQLVELFFKFGFPAPVRDVNKYSRDLAAHLTSELGL